MMNCNYILILIIFKFVVVGGDTGELPRATGIPPRMLMLDNETSVVDYSNSFIIPEFYKVMAVVVFTDKTKNIGTATREIMNSNVGTNFEKLRENYSVKVKVNPCQRISYFVRIIYNGTNSSHIDSEETQNEPQYCNRVSIVDFIQA